MQTEQTNMPPVPALKRGVELFPVDGGLYHVYDPSTSKHFRMGKQEVQWLKLLDGKRSKGALSDLIPLEYVNRRLAAAARLDLPDGRLLPSLRPTR